MLEFANKHLPDEASALSAGVRGFQIK